MYELYKHIVDGEVSDYITFLFMLFILATWIYFVARSIFAAYRLEMIEKVIEYNFMLSKRFATNKESSENFDQSSIDE